MKIFFYTLFTLLCCTPLVAQMEQSDGSVRYGDEWIRPGATYLRIAVAEDGAYRITPEQLAPLGWATTGPEAARLQLWYQGEPQPSYVDAAGVHFFGRQNRGEFDRYLYSDPDEDQLNPRYSMFTDTAVYYLEQLPAGQTGARFSEASHDPDSGTPVVPYLWRTSEQVSSDHPIKAFTRVSGFSIYYSHFETAEGYGSRSENDLLSSNGTTTTAWTLTAPQAMATAEPATLRLRFGVGFDQHRQALYVDNTQVDTFTNNNWSVHAGQWPVPTASLSDGELALELRGTAGDRDKASVAYTQLRYPALPTAAGAAFLTFELPSSAQPATLELSNVPGSGTARLFDRTAQRWYAAPVVSGSVRYGLPAFAEAHDFVLLTDAGWRSTAAQSQPVAFPAVADNPVDFLILTTDRLLAAGDAVARYAAYRSSATGGGYRVRVATVEDSYERHGYGIARHPQAIRNYLQRLRSEHPELKYLLIVGKGREYRDVRTAGQLTAAQGTFLVPTFGYPGSDVLVSSSRLAEEIVTLATGRIATLDNAEIAIYLDKLQATEDQNNAPQTLAGKGWTKNILHLGGGRLVYEQNAIRGSLESMEDIIKEGRFGALVKGVYKTSTDPIETSRLGQIFETINAGTSLVTFFGHSSAGNFDLNIDTPENYDNAGRCPMMLSLGCYSGDHFIGARSVGEEFLFLPNRGALAFGASNSLGFIPSLANLGREYYQNLSGPMYGEGIGEIMRATLVTLAQSSNNLSLAEQFNLQGDPAFRLHAQPGPDLVFNADEIRLEPSLPNAQADSFAVRYQLVNIGENSPIDSIAIRFSQQTPSGEIKDLLTQKIALTGATTDANTQLPNLGRSAIGNNRLFLELDPDDDIAERPNPAAENNNTLTSSNGQAGLAFTIVSNTAFPVYPPRFSLVGTEQPVFRVSTSNALAPRQTYLFQLDTSLLFAQPLVTGQLTAPGGVLEWQPDYAWQDSVVYYWRVSPDSIPGRSVGYNWEASSFTYLKDTPSGWGQGHADQWRENTYEQIYLEPGKVPVFAFADNVLDIELRNQVKKSPGNPFYINESQNFGSPFSWNVKEGINVIVLSYPKLQYWLNLPGGLYGSVYTTTSNWPNNILPFSFPTKEVEDRSKVIDFLETVVPDSFYVIVYSAQFELDSDYDPEEWAVDSLILGGKNIFNILEKQGADQIRSTENKGALPYAFFYQKGVTPINEQLADSLKGFVQLKHTFLGKWFEGRFRTVKIGPASRWRSIRQHYYATNQPLASDSVSLDIYGIKTGGQEELLRTIPSFAPRTDYDISDISAEEYPILRLGLFFIDEENRTPPPIRHLIVHYDGLPDLAITDAVLQNPADTLLRGAPWGLQYRVRNISEYAVASSTGTYAVSQLGSLDNREINFSIPGLEAGQSWSDTIKIQTDSLFSRANFSLQINPADQPHELYRFNNVLTQELEIDRDESAPVVTVAFDGHPVLDGDIVAPNPTIDVVLTDENRLLRLNDPALVRLRLRVPGSGDFVAIPETELQWSSAPAEGENRASILYTPTFTEDGMYTLQVAAEDRSGNLAGKALYEIRFEVITRRSVSNVLPYPNPFTTSTRFVYTLTGAEPADFRIQIMSVSGRIVREITKAELGPLSVGTHQTEFAWDGRDTYGDQLANGVYLYRVIVRDEEQQDYEMRDNGTNQYFRNGIGKIVLLR